MQTRSSLQRHSNSESSDRVVANIKPRPWGDPHQHQATQTPRHDFSHVDLFAHDPGPRTISHGIQAKLTVGTPNDVYEQEADAVAEQVMTMPAPQVQQQTTVEGEIEETEEALQPKLLGDLGMPLVQRQAEGAKAETEMRRQPFNLHSPDRPSPPVIPWWGIQAKLTIGQPNDVYEQEADQVADRVMSMAAPPTANVQRQVEAEEPEEIQTKPLAETITPLVQRQEIKDEEPLQAKCEACEEEAPIQRTADGVPQAQPDLEGRLNAS